MKTLFCFFLLTLQIQAAQLRLDVVGPNGRRDISVTTQNASTFGELGWADESIPKSIPRRCAMIPLCLSNPTNEPAWVGPNRTNAALFVTTPMVPGVVLSNNVHITIQTFEGDIVRESDASVPFMGLVKPDGTVGLAPGEHVYAWDGGGRCRLDLSGIPKGRFFWIWIQFRAGGDTANIWIPAEIGSMQVTQLTDMAVE